MTKHAQTPEEKEKKRKKQFKKMGKILTKLWDLDPAFQSPDNDDEDGAVTCLTHLGQKIDQKAYRLGRHGWEEFASDLGGVYNRHIQEYVLLFWNEIGWSAIDW